MYRELLLGCGHQRDRRVTAPNLPSGPWKHLTTVDHNYDTHPDILLDLSDLNEFASQFETSFFDEIHAYEVLEHTGQQGDWRFFFAQFSEFWRILKPGGFLIGTCPRFESPWSWGDPSHTRLVSNESLTFLIQSEYIRQLDEGDSAMSDFRHVYHADFDLVHTEWPSASFHFALQAVKPSRWQPREERKKRVPREP